MPPAMVWSCCVGIVLFSLFFLVTSLLELPLFLLWLFSVAAGSRARRARGWLPGLVFVFFVPGGRFCPVGHCWVVSCWVGLVWLMGCSPASLFIGFVWGSFSLDLSSLLPVLDPLTLLLDFLLTGPDLPTADHLAPLGLSRCLSNLSQHHHSTMHQIK